jgi:carbamoyltransferase
LTEAGARQTDAVILGVNAFHADSSACLMVDGQLRMAVAEERLGRRQKHSPCFPAEAIRRILADSGVRLRDVTHVAIPRDVRANRPEKFQYALRHPRRSIPALVEHLRRSSRTEDMVTRLAGICGEEAAPVRFQTVAVEHHLAHVASSYYLSPFDDVTAGFSYDASGDFVSALMARCEGTRITPVARVALPSSLGFFYTALCQFIGFDEFGEEYKVMGLAPYGEDAYADVMKDLLRLDPSGWFHLAPGYFGMHQGGASGEVRQDGRIHQDRMFTPLLTERLGAPRSRTEEITRRERDVARSTQVRFEEAVIHCANRLHDLVPTRRLVTAGGCALNGVANARILRDTKFTEMYIHPAASDDGTSVGAALHCYYNTAGGTNRFSMDHAYLGPRYGDRDLEKAILETGRPFRRLDDAALIEAAARLLADGLVVGWYQGASEWGPRALGNRSILANPTRPDMKDLLNAKVKRRESFRPFAPTVLEEHADRYFAQSVKSPFMMHVVSVRPEWQARLPAVTHVDGTARIQTLTRAANPRYYALIEAFARHTGVHVLLNTSFNENEPIVDTPAQALACFERTDIDALCLGNFLLEKP